MTDISPIDPRQPSIETAPCPGCGQELLKGFVCIPCLAAAKIKAEPGLYAKGEQFDWESESGKINIVFNVTALLSAVAAMAIPFEKIKTPLDRNFAREWLPKRGLEMDRVRTMTPKRMAEPVLFACMLNLTVLLIDGTHRYYARYLRGKPDVRGILLQPAVWGPFAKITTKE